MHTRWARLVSFGSTPSLACRNVQHWDNSQPVLLEGMLAWGLCEVDGLGTVRCAPQSSTVLNHPPPPPFFYLADRELPRHCEARLSRGNRITDLHTSSAGQHEISLSVNTDIFLQCPTLKHITADLINDLTFHLQEGVLPWGTRAPSLPLPGTPCVRHACANSSSEDTSQTYFEGGSGRWCLDLDILLGVLSRDLASTHESQLGRATSVFAVSRDVDTELCPSTCTAPPTRLRRHLACISLVWRRSLTGLRRLKEIRGGGMNESPRAQRSLSEDRRRIYMRARRFSP